MQYGTARPAAQHAAARLLQDLAASHARPLASQSNTVSLLTQTLLAKGTSPELQCTAAAALKHLCAVPSAQAAVLTEPGALGALSRMISSQDPGLQVAGARLLARLAPRVDLVAVVNTGALQALCARGLRPQSGARVMGHTPRSAAVLSVCQLLLPALERGVGRGEGGGSRALSESSSFKDRGQDEKPSNDGNNKSAHSTKKGTWVARVLLHGGRKKGGSASSQEAAEVAKSDDTVAGQGLGKVVAGEGGEESAAGDRQQEEEAVDQGKDGQLVGNSDAAEGAVAPAVASSLLRVQGAVVHVHTVSFSVGSVGFVCVCVCVWICVLMCVFSFSNVCAASSLYCV